MKTVAEYAKVEENKHPQNTKYWGTHPTKYNMANSDSELTKKCELKKMKSIKV